MADTLESLEIKVQHNASGADAEINGVATAIGRLKTALTGAPAALKELASAVKAVNDAFKGGTAKYDKFAESMLNVATSAELLGENSSHVMTLANAMNTLTSVKVTAGSFNALAKGVEGVGTAAQTITPEAISNLDKMATSLAKLQGVDLQGLGSAMSAVNRGGRSATPGTATPLPAEMQEMISTASAIDVLEAKLASLHVAMQEAFNSGDVDKALNLRNQILQTEAALEKARAAAEKAGKAAKEAGNGIKDLAKEAEKSQSPLGNFVSSLKRIAFYRIIRGIIKSITQAFQEGLQNAYAFSQGIKSEGHRFATALDGMSTASLKMKNQLGSAFIGLLAAIAPVVNAIISLATQLATALSQLFAVFTGGTYLKAADVPNQWAKAAGGAAGAAKEWKNQLMGFDEINRLDEPPNGGGGGGGGGVDLGAAFEDTQIDGIFAKIRDKFLEFKDSLDFEPLKKSVGGLLDSLKGLGDYISEELAWAWDNILVPLGKWTIEKGLPAAIDLLAASFETLTIVLEKLSPIGKKLWDDFLGPLAGFVGNTIADGVEALTEDIEHLNRVMNGSTSTERAVKTASGKYRYFGGRGGSFGESTVGTATVDTNTTKLPQLTPAFKEYASNMLKLILPGLGIGKTITASGAVIQKQYKKSANGITQITEKASKDNRNAWEAFSEDFKKIFGSVSTEGESAWSELSAKVIESTGNMTSKAKTQVESLRSTTLQKVDGIKSGVETVMTGIDSSTGNIFSSLAKSITAKTATAETNATANFKTLKNNASYEMQTLTGNVSNSFANMSASSKNSTSEILEDTKNKLSSIVENAKSKFSSMVGISAQAVQDLKNGMNFNNFAPFSNWYSTQIEPWFAWEKWRELGNRVVQGIKSTLNLANISPVGEWFNSNVAPWFTASKWQSLGQKAIQGIKNGLSSLSLPKFHLTWGTSYKSFSVLGKTLSMNIPWPSLSFYKEGGFPDAGQLFVAREAGPELVGTMGGRNAVANNDQIIEGIRQGVYDAVRAAMGSVDNGGGETVVRVYLDSREIAAGQRSLAIAQGV